MRIALLLLLAAACSKDATPGTGSAAPITTGSGSAAKKGNGFSASLSAELAKEGSSAPSVPLTTGSAATTPEPSAAVGSNGGSNAGSNAMAATTTAVATPPAVAMTGSAAKGSAAPTTTATTTTTTTKPATTTAPATSAPATTAPATTAPATASARVPVKPSPEIAAIKMDLEPNWVRDVGEAGTISFVLNVPNTSETRVFSFHYGYDPAGAPDDRDAYMKWLADNKLLSVSLNRQRGAAWYLEGSDGNGAPAFRTLVMYGGKHLVCWGTLYKDAASNSLGDLRDKVVMTAKQICGTLAL